ncbi:MULTISPECIES: DUF5684 domain-containing protein [Microbacterium]|uniref:Signal peptidase I n=1 Tax=Microbacterium trichothecenolyticum TaxID=69370 RepID=A0A0M2H2E6_MICTR|nr:MULTISPECIES: DUF5684 domain-containing protein [Microbacterium]KJL40587.1 hypothetical protein RS82_03203 [Microbacterium trichothecenolyticum]MDR7188469.1 hypothetical protein [Microbacterium sp. BE35]
MTLLSDIEPISQGVSAGAVFGYVVVGLIYWIATIAAYWRTFTKAGYPGWLAIIPIVNLFVLVKVAGYSAWLGLLWFVPIANIVLAIIVAFRNGRAFGHGGAFAFFLLFLLNPIGYFITGFSNDTYTKPA